MSQELISLMVNLSKKDGQERSIYELKNGQWIIKLSSEPAPSSIRKWESIETALGWMSREIGQNYQYGRHDPRFH